MKQNTFRNLRTMGLIGLAVQTGINLVVFALRKTEFFSDQWWSDFFPGYVVWLVFAVVGFAGARGKACTDQNS
jgi:hypothetical protein